MLVTGFPAGAFAANCYLVAPAPGEECVIVDPGQDAQRGIEELLARYRLKPIAVLLTHGHLDHVWSVAPVCGAKGIPAYIHPDDRPDMVDVTVGEKHRDRLQPVAVDQLLDPPLRVLPRVDDHALLAWGRRDNVAVGGKGTRGKPSD